MATEAQLIGEILVELGVYQAGQDLPPEDYRVVERRLPFSIATLHSENIYSLDDLANIPDEALEPLAQYLAGRFVQAFGLTGAERSAILEQQAAAEKELRFLKTMPYTGARQRAEYF